MDATVVCIAQTKKSVQVEPCAAWFPRGTLPFVELSGQRDWTCLLGAITEDSNSFFSRVEEYDTADHAKHFILAVYEEFDDGLIVMLDEAPYFQASAVTDLAARDDLASYVTSVFARASSGRRALEAATINTQKPSSSTYSLS